MSRFGRISENTCCHGNTLNIFVIKIFNLERGAIKPMLPLLHIFTKFVDHVYDCENIQKIMVLILKNNMAAIADLLENHCYVLKFKILQLALSDLHKM